MKSHNISQEQYKKVKRQWRELGAPKVVSFIADERASLGRSLASLLGLEVSDSGLLVSMLSKEEYVRASMEAVCTGEPLPPPSLVGLLSHREFIALAKEHAMSVADLEDNQYVEALALIEKKFPSVYNAMEKSCKRMPQRQDTSTSSVRK